MKKRMKMTGRRLMLAMLCSAGMAGAAQAVDFSVSGFGTIGYAQSDQPYNYQRFINQSGTFNRDTVFGAQLNAQFNPEWGATVQAKLAPALGNDSTWQPTISWAFLSYRPSDDLLLRAGKLRIPFYLNSESSDVGETFDVARLPVEVYATASTMDFIGASFAKTWDWNENELELDGYWGRTNSPWRFYARDFDPTNTLRPTGTPGSFWAPLKIESRGVRLSLQREGNTYQAGVHHAITKGRNGESLGPSTYTLGPLSPFIGNYYWPAADTVYRISSTTFNLGADVGLGQGYRAAGEYVRRKNAGSELSPDSESYYLTLSKEIGEWTPYVTHARIATKNRALYQATNGARTALPAMNAFQRVLADAIVVYDQDSWAVGASYAVDNSSKIKAEWSSVHAGVGSNFIDAPPGGESANQRINVFSLSYSFVF